MTLALFDILLACILFLLAACMIIFLSNCPNYIRQIQQHNYYDSNNNNNDINNNNQNYEDPLIGENYKNKEYENPV